MAVTTIGIIDIGSYDVTLEIFQISRKDGIHCIDRLQRRLEIGRGTFSTGRIPMEMVDELCTVLQDFVRVTAEYRVDAVRALATSAIREAENDLFVLGKIRQMTGLDVQVLSNSEQRFLSYKAIASVEGVFHKMIQDGTVIIDLDGGSCQVSMFDKGELYTTQNLRMGSLRLRERLNEASAKTSDYEELVSQMITYDVASFKKMYLDNHKIKNVIFSGDFITEMIFRDKKNQDRSTRVLSREQFEKWYRKISGKSVTELAIENSIPTEYASLLRPSAIVYHTCVEALEPEIIWTPGMHISRGLAYDYAERKDLITARHDFNNDIVTCARHIAKRYGQGKPHIDNMDMTGCEIFDEMKKIHGLGKRGRLLLRVAIMLHDVGKYISFNLIGESSYNIIMANEIIGLSHAEREIIALAVKYLTEPLPQYDDLVLETSLDEKRYLEVAALTAIIRYVNALDRGHLQKVQAIRAERKGQELVIHVEVNRRYDLEKGMISQETEFFHEVFGIRPVLKVKRIM